MASSGQKKRSVTDELNRSVFWRVSFDNFKMKFAKCIGSALVGVKKLLNLITVQVSTRRTTTNNPKTQHVPTLQSLAKLAIKSDFQDVISLPHN